MKGPMQIGKELCAAWGLDPNEVRAITIDIRPSAVPSAIVELFVNDKIVEVLKKYELHDPGDAVAGAA